MKYFSIISSILLKLFGEKRFVKSVKVFHTSIKSTNPIQKYPQIIESNACNLKIFVFMFSLSINVLISFGIRSTPKESKHHYFVRTMQPNEFQYQSSHQDLLYRPHPLFQRNCVQVNYL